MYDVNYILTDRDVSLLTTCLLDKVLKCRFMINNNPTMGNKDIMKLEKRIDDYKVLYYKLNSELNIGQRRDFEAALTDLSRYRSGWRK